jgi:peptidoglycan/xylan/chitin deacetylase (PgdA/CDA1 family)
MDNPYYDWSPISTRPRLVWPHGARVALGVVLTLESMDWYPPEGTVLPSVARRARGAYPRVPDVHTTSQYEYGNRVGVFRVVDVLERHGIRPVVAMDAAVAARAPFLVQHLLERGAEFAGHGISSETMISEEMPEEVESDLVRRSLEAVAEATGQRPRGWIGSEYGESTRTVRLLAEHGVDHVMDWPTDEQPHLMKVPRGRLVNLPVAVELDDVLTHVDRCIPVGRFTRMVTEHFDRLHHDGADTGRLMLLNIHPWVMGQPFRIRHLDAALAHITGHDAVWRATGTEITDWYLGQQG